MSGNVIVMLIVGGLGAIVVCVVIYYIIRLGKGSIRLNLPQTAFNPGETITGSFDLVPRKGIEGNRLYVALVAREVTKWQEGGKTRTRTREVFRDERTLEEGQQYPAGTTKTYSFEINTPAVETPEFMQSPLAQVLKAGAQLLSGRRRYLKWRLDVRLDAKGVDLATGKAVSVNLPAQL